MKRLTLFILTITLTLLLMESTFVGQTFLSAFATTVKIDPASQQIPLPGTGTVNVAIEDVANLGAFEFKLKYDGNIVKILQPTDVQLGDFLGSTGRTVIPIGPNIDNDAGEMTFGAFSFGGNQGPDGNGVLAKIIFTAQSEGTSVLDLTDVQVTDINGNVIPIDVINGQIQVVAPPPTAIVKIDPESQQIPLPGTGTVNVSIEDVTNLGAFEFKLKYDGSIVRILQADDVQLGDFLGSTGRTVVPIGPEIDNDAGEMTFGAFSFGGNPGPDGDGVLATIIFTAQSEGTSILDLTDVQVTDINGGVIPTDVIDGQIQVNQPSTVVKIDPESQQIPLPGVGTVNVSIEDVTNLGAFEFKLKYDGNIVKILQADDVQLGDFLGSSGRTVVPIGPNIDNDAGEMTFGAFSFGENPGPDGDGVLAKIIFTAQSEGTSVLDLTNFQVIDVNGGVIPTDVIDGQIQVNQPSTVVKIDPEFQQIPLPGVGTVNVAIEDVINLGAFEFKLKYDGNIVKILQVDDVQLGDFLGSTGRTVVPIGPNIDNDAGEMTFGAFSFGGNPGPDGDGVLATIIFTAQSEGTSVLDLTDVQVTDINGNVISIDVIDGQIQAQPLPSCSLTVISKEQVVLDDLRQFRDNRLTKNETGQKLIRLYYRHSSEVASILLKHPMLSIRSAAILKDVMPGIHFLVGNEEGKDIVMNPFLVARIKELFFDIGKEGSEELVQTLSMLSDLLEEYEGMFFSQIWQAMGKKPEDFALFQNHPNPFNPDTWIPYQLSESSYVWIRIYNVSGKLVRTLRLGTKPAGFYLTKAKAAYWDGKNESGEQVASGVYFYQLQAGDFTAIRKMLMVK